MKKKIYILSILIIVIAVATVLFMRWNNQESKGVESTATEEETDKEFSDTEITEADAMGDDYGTETAEKDAEMTQKKMLPISCMDEEGEEVELTWDEIFDELDNGNYNKEIVNIDKIQKLYTVVTYDDRLNLMMGIDFEEGGLYGQHYYYLMDGPLYAISESQMEQVKDILKDYIYDWEYKYELTSGDECISDSEIISYYYYEIIIVDECGRIAVYTGDCVVPKDFNYFLEEIRQFDGSSGEFPEFDK